MTREESEMNIPTYPPIQKVPKLIHRKWMLLYGIEGWVLSNEKRQVSKQRPPETETEPRRAG